MYLVILLRVRGTALRLAIAPILFIILICAHFICLHWLAEINYVCMARLPFMLFV